MIIKKNINAAKDKANRRIQKLKRILDQEYIESPEFRKNMFVLSFMVINCIQYSLGFYPAVVLFIFSVLFPVLFFLRLGLYSKTGAHLFMLDPCYVINWATLIYIIVLPQSRTIKRVLFSLSTGVVMWAVIPYRNTLAFHDIDKVTSVFIHTMPTNIFFCLHWLPINTTRGWIGEIPLDDMRGRALLRHYPIEYDSVLTLVFSPMLFITLHGLIYWLVVYVIVQPDEKYLDSYRYLSRKNSFFSRICSGSEMFGYLKFLMLNVAFNAAAAVIGVLAYHAVLFHCATLILQWLLIIRNAASYYIDYFTIVQDTDEKKSG